MSTNICVYMFIVTLPAYSFHHINVQIYDTEDWSSSFIQITIDVYLNVFCTFSRLGSAFFVSATIEECPVRAPSLAI